MTNSPVFDQQLAIDAYWREIGGDVMLPGTSRAADRYVRASYYLDQLPADVDERTAAAAVLSVQRNASRPMGSAQPGAPEVSQTLWTSIADSTALRYYYQDTLSPDIVWVDLDKLAFDRAVPSRRLGLQGHPIIHGEVSGRFEAAEPFTFLGT
jgi:choloylglycine hydrolase